MADEPRPAPSSKRCLVCGKPVVASFRPFCSERCRQVDLGRWLSGHYIVPGEPEPEGDGNSNQ